MKKQPILIQSLVLACLVSSQANAETALKIRQPKTTIPAGEIHAVLSSAAKSAKAAHAANDAQLKRCQDAGERRFFGQAASSAVSGCLANHVVQRVIVDRELLAKIQAAQSAVEDEVQEAELLMTNSRSRRSALVENVANASNAIEAVKAEALELARTLDLDQLSYAEQMKVEGLAAELAQARQRHDTQRMALDAFDRGEVNLRRSLAGKLKQKADIHRQVLLLAVRITEGEEALKRLDIKAAISPEAPLDLSPPAVASLAAVDYDTSLPDAHTGVEVDLRAIQSNEAADFLRDLLSEANDVGGEQ